MDHEFAQKFNRNDKSETKVSVPSGVPVLLVLLPPPSQGGPLGEHQVHADAPGRMVSIQITI